MRVLVVEDEPEMRTMLRDGLREHGHAVAVASDGQDGIFLATKHEFDLILLDVLLPQVNGYSIATALRSQPSTWRQQPYMRRGSRPATFCQYQRGTTAVPHSKYRV